MAKRLIKYFRNDDEKLKISEQLEEY
jgi:hypothetical protein